MKGKEANGVGSQQSGTVSEHVLSSITTADAHTSPASSRLNWHPRLYKWTRPFRWKTKSGFCACAITIRFHSTSLEGHKTNAQYEGRALLSVSTFHAQTIKRNSHVSTLKISAELNYIYPLDETDRSVT